MIKPFPHSGLAVIALFKLLKGLVVLLVGAGLLWMVDPDIATFLAPLMDVLHLNVHSRLLNALVAKVTALSPHSVLLMGYVSLLYATLLFIEGLGLWLEAAWAACLTVISTSIFLPVEVYEVIRQVSVVHVAVLFINLTIVGYLVAQLGLRSMGQN